MKNSYGYYPATPSSLSAWVNTQNTKYMIPVVRGDLTGTPLMFLEISTSESSRWYYQINAIATSWESVNTNATPDGGFTFKGITNFLTSWTHPFPLGGDAYWWQYELGGTGDEPDDYATWVDERNPDRPGYTKILMNLIFDRD